MRKTLVQTLLAAFCAILLEGCRMTSAGNMLMLSGGKKLPYGAVVEYLENTTGNSSSTDNMSYIDTGVSLSHSAIATVKFMPLATNHAGCVAGVGDTNTSADRFQLYQFQNGNFSCRMDGATWSSGVSWLNAIHEVSMDVGNATFTHDGVTVSMPLNAYPPNKAFFLFRRHGNFNNDTESTTHCRIYGASIYSGEILVRDFKPVVDKQGVACMYDRVSGQCFYNAGSGGFVAGPIV